MGVDDPVPVTIDDVAASLRRLLEVPDIADLAELIRSISTKTAEPPSHGRFGAHRNV